MTQTKETIKIIYVGNEISSFSILKDLMLIDAIEVLGIFSISQNISDIEHIFNMKLITKDQFISLLHNTNIIIDTSKSTIVSQIISKYKNLKITVLDSYAAKLIKTIIDNHDDLTKTKELNVRLETLLNATQEGVQIVDSKGTIIYINKAFTDMSKLLPETRIGHNIFDVSPYGALAKVLKTKKPVLGNVNTIIGTDVKGYSNGYPIIVEGKMLGAISVFREISDVEKMAERLKKSKNEITSLKEEINKLYSAKYSFNNLIGISKNFSICIKTAQQSANTRSTILITGESGTGKELFAHAIHNYSDRSYRPFIKINCAAIPEALLESELFGYEKGAFSGALKTTLGKFELAQGGTIFLDEIGDMSHTLQSKLLRVLQEKEVERLGSSYSRKIDVRIIAATNRNLQKLMETGEFREDLYYRLNVININVPPLRDRIEDIPYLAETLLQKMNMKFKKYCQLDDQVLLLLRNYNWPGNVRELENLLERVVLLANKSIIGIEMLQSYLPAHNSNALEDIMTLEELEKRMIYKALDKYGHSYEEKKIVAKKLNISLATLYNKLKKYNG